MEPAAVGDARPLSPHRERLLRAVDEIRDELIAGADEAQALGQLPDRSVAALRSVGYYGMKTPEAAGGLEIDPLTFMEVLERVAQIDASTAWALMVSTTAAGLAAVHLGEEGLVEVFGSSIAGGTAPTSLVPASLVPTMAGTTQLAGKGHLAEGGMRVSGRYPFGSGAPNAEWIVTGCRMVDGDRPQFFVVPASEVTIVGNWQAVGLRGSGSGDFELDDVFVPVRRMFVSTEPLRGGPLYRVPSLISHEHVVIATGVARHALDELLRSVERERRNDGKALRDVEAIQRLVARSSLQLRAVRALAYSLVGETWEAVCAGEHMPDDASAEIRALAVYATEVGLEIVTGAFRAVGGDSVFLTNAIQRCFRDLNVAAQHMHVSERGYEDYGRWLLGIAERPRDWRV